MADKPLCAIPGCGKQSAYKGLCNAHYLRKRKYGNPTAGGAMRHLMADTCSVDGCDERRDTKGYCHRHYQQFRRTGDPVVQPSEAECLQWLRDHMGFDGPDCLIWPFARLSNGYPAVRFENTTTTASRVMCTMVKGEPPSPEMHAAHSCGRGHDACVHPGHLDWKTPVSNNADKIAHGTTNRGRRSATVKLTEDQVRQIRALEGALSSPEIAGKFGISRQAVNDIISRRRWAWLS